MSYKIKPAPPLGDPDGADEVVAVGTAIRK
jgi:hypothetical protein